MDLNKNNPDRNSYKSSASGQKFTLVHFLLISVIILMAVIIAFMSTSMRAILDENKQAPKNNNSGGNMNNIITTENTTENETKEEISGEIPTAEHIETPVQTSAEIPTETHTITTAITTTTTTTTTELAPETTAVTVSTEVINEIPVEATTITTIDTTMITTTTIQNDYIEIYNGAYYACVNTQNDPLNIRSGAGQNYKIIGTIPKGKYIDIYMTDDSKWYYTTYNGVSGYVSADYITLILSGEFYGYDDNYNGYYSSYESSTATVKTSGSDLYLRDSASINGDILGKIPNGTTITVIEYDSNWCYVEYNGTTGYASTDYLSF